MKTTLEEWPENICLYDCEIFHPRGGMGSCVCISMTEITVSRERDENLHLYNCEITLSGKEAGNFLYYICDLKNLPHEQWEFVRQYSSWCLQATRSGQLQW